MTITWQEREHEEQDMISLNNQGTVEALKNCGLLKYFRLSGMRQQIELCSSLFMHGIREIRLFTLGTRWSLLPLMIFNFLLDCRGEVPPSHFLD